MRFLTLATLVSLAAAGVPLAAHHGTSITYFVDKSIT
jgi:hypothetical protein